MPTRRTTHSITLDIWPKRDGMERLWVTLAGFLLLICSACTRYPLCDPELKLNTTYVASISEVYNQQSNALYDSRYDLDLGQQTWPTCASWDGLGSAATITLRTTSTSPVGACDFLTGVLLSLPNGVTWKEETAFTLHGDFRQLEIFAAQGILTTGPCLGYYKVVMERPVAGTSVFSATTPGTLPSLVLGRTYGPEENDSSPSCPQCADTFVAQLAVAKQ